MKAKTKTTKKADSAKPKAKFIPPWLNKGKDVKDATGKPVKKGFVPFAKKASKKK
jgi:hypothetical protein